MDRARREEVFRRIVKSIKRNLLTPPRTALSGGRFVRSADLVAEVLKKAVGMVWADGRLARLEAQWRGALAGELRLSEEQASHTESGIMGASKEAIFEGQGPGYEPLDGLQNVALVHTLTGHSHEVHSVAFSPDGRLLRPCGHRMERAYRPVGGRARRAHGQGQLCRRKPRRPAPCQRRLGPRDQDLEKCPRAGRGGTHWQPTLLVEAGLTLRAGAKQAARLAGLTYKLFTKGMKSGL